MGKILGTAALVLVVTMASVIIGVADAAFFGAEHGENITRYAVGFGGGIVVGIRQLTPTAPAP